MDNNAVLYFCEKKKTIQNGKNIFFMMDYVADSYELSNYTKIKDHFFFHEKRASDTLSFSKNSVALMSE